MLLTGGVLCVVASPITGYAFFLLGGLAYQIMGIIWSILLGALMIYTSRKYRKTPGEAEKFVLPVIILGMLGFVTGVGILVGSFIGVMGAIMARNEIKLEKVGTKNRII